MRALAVVLFITASICYVGSLAYRTPLDGNRDFAWVSKTLGSQISIGVYGIAVAYDGKGGTEYYSAYIWPPRAYHDFISDEASKFLRDDRVWHGDPSFNPDLRREYEKIRERDKRLAWSIGFVHRQ